MNPSGSDTRRVKPSGPNASELWRSAMQRLCCANFFEAATGAVLDRLIEQVLRPLMECRTRWLSLPGSSCRSAPGRSWAGILFLRRFADGRSAFPVRRRRSAYSAQARPPHESRCASRRARSQLGVRSGCVPTPSRYYASGLPTGAGLPQRSPSQQSPLSASTSARVSLLGHRPRLLRASCRPTLV